MFKPKRRNLQEINSSSMADIAFLLLIFFLVTTTIATDKGVTLVLPADGNELEVNKKNISDILINQAGKVFMDDEDIEIKNIADIAKKKITQNSKIIFSVTAHHRTKYKIYIKLLDQLKLAKAKKISIANPPNY